jgi:hypothetical protein
MAADLTTLAERVAAEDAADEQAPAGDPTITPFEGWADAGVGSRDLDNVETDNPQD